MAYDERLSNLATYAKNASKEYKKQAWMRYFELKGKYIDVKYTYASTVHKLQGSTYENVYIDFKEIIDMSRYSEMETMYRLIYVAITRATNKVKVLV